jgi:asparagine synthase (glutamine-hydrolysing)
LDDAGRITPSHPWLTPPRHFLPGKSAHITMLALAQGFAEGHDPQQFPAIVHPLLSQPVVETCLAVPSWLWVADGRNRAVARKAFDADLPAKIAQRRTKGSPECFVGEIFEHHHARLKSMILDGMLAQRGFLDRDAVEWAFHDTQMMAPGMASELLRIVDVEAWLQARSA